VAAPAATGLSITILPLSGLPEIHAGADLAALIAAAARTDADGLRDGDIVVVASKIVSKAEGRRVLQDPLPGTEARRLAAVTGFPAPEVELILSESRAVLRSAPGVLVVETLGGFVCANGGVDRSNAGPEGGALLLPVDPDASADALRARLAECAAAAVAVVISDTFGRPFRHGLVNVALGVAGLGAIRDHRGQVDPEGRALKGTEIAAADELCAAAELVMGKLDRVPAAIVRGYAFPPAAGSGRQLIRDRATDYFR